MKDSLKSFCLATLLFLHLPFVSYAQVQLPTIDVGTADTRFAVSPLGGASYSVTFDAPQGLPGIQPKLELAYNSQAGNGLAGVGFSLSGISVITRGPRTIWYDGVASGITHGNDDAFFLDGQRLIEQENNVGADSVVYCMESSPYTRVVLYGRNASTQAGMWFRVTTPDGIVSEYGHISGKQSYTKGNISKVNAWYITRTENAIGNSITFQYTFTNYCLYPQTISYGPNTIEFSYENRPDTLRFSLEGVAGYVSKRLKSVKTKSGTNVFREYTLNYTTSGDATASAYSRLLNIAVKNGMGEAMNPVSFEWEYLKQYTTQPQTMNVNLVESTDTSTFLRGFDVMTADFNGDGVSDLVQHANVKHLLGYNWAGAEIYTYYNNYYVFLSNMTSNGSVNYSSSPIQHSYNGNFALDDWKMYISAPSACDIDGDGLEDLVIPYFVSTNSTYVEYHVLYGKNINNHLPRGIGYRLQHSTEIPIYSVSDFDNDRRSDIILLEVSGANGNYDCLISKYHAGGDSLMAYHFTLPLASNPKKLITGDFNSDGMSDILVICQNGYRIFWNRGGGLSSNTFSSSDSTTGTNLTDNNMVRDGDFNGDGIPDILTNNTNSSDWYFYLGNGDGTFTKKLACQKDVYDQTISNDDDKFTCIVYDMDGDGKSDVYMSKAMYYSLGGLQQVRSYWMLSDGVSLVQRKASTSQKAENASPCNYMLGNFSGSSQPELAHYGYDCWNGVNASVSPVLRQYPNTNYAAGNGLVKTFTNGLGHSVQVGYKLLTDNTVYSRSELGDSPFFLLKPALPVVATTIIGNGIAGNQTSHYSYEDLLAHQLRGLLGFTATSVENVTLGTVTNTTVERDEATQLVKKSTETTTLNGNTSTTVNNYLCHFHHNTKALYQSLASTTNTDMDGHVTNIVYTCDSTRNNILLDVTQTNYDNAQVKTTYSGYVCKAGQYLPTTIVNRRKHPNDSQYFTKTNSMTYNNLGLKTSETTFVGTPAAVTTTYTYDSYGNITSSTSSGSGVENITMQYTYDSTKRFVTQSLERGYIRNVYTHDVWGNVLTATDQTCSSNPLTTTNTYDNWGRLVSSISPEGITSTWEWGWDHTVQPIGYYIHQTEGGKPWVKTYYDNIGRKWKTLSIGPKQAGISETLTFNNKGLQTSANSVNGYNSTNTSYTYDNRGRMLTKLDCYGITTTYSYGSDWIRSTKNGRSYTKYYDSWGNVKKSTDPLNTVNLYYNSNGNLKSSVSESNTVTMQYDAAGRRTQLTDPSAGTTTYTYDAYNRLLTQTDARGVTISNTYNTRGQLTNSTAGTVATNYVYGTDASNNGLLLSANRGIFQADYSYDSFRRITNETRYYSQSHAYPRSKSYTYNAQGQVATVTFPNQLQVSYEYDNYGNINRILSGNTQLYELDVYQGNVMQCNLGNGMTLVELYDNLGRTQEAGLILPNNTTKYYQWYEYSQNTGNLTARIIGDTNSDEEEFTYDALDRLTSWTKDGTTLDYLYESDGNLYFKRDLGSMYYYLNNPYAISDLENPLGPLALPQSYVSSAYNEFGKASQLSNGNNITTIDYGPDFQRWKMTGSDKAFYFDNYEEITVNNFKRNYAYLGNNVMAVSDNTNGVRFYYLMKDHLGSIIGIVNVNGDDVFTASYDPWGRQTVTIDSLHFHRGFTGHEMLPKYDLINMNGRLYDPYLARFLSPDNYVQIPDFSQSFNRYSYCLNNPLKYVDPDGENPIVIGAIIGAIAGAYIGGVATNDGELNPLQWNYNQLETYLGLFAGGVLGGVTGSVLGGSTLWTTSFTFSTPWATIGTSLGISTGAIGAGTKFKFNLHWTTAAGGGYDSVEEVIEKAVERAGNAFDEYVVHYHHYMDNIHTGLDVVGMIPGGDFADLANAGLYLLEGDFSNAGISAAAMVPVVGGIATGGKLANKGFSSYRKFKKAYGKAGDGMEWHHIVEQRPANISQFGSERIHNIDNMIALPADVHRKISGRYSSIRKGTNNMRVTDWLNGKDYDFQYQYGLDVLKEYGY